MLTLLVRNGLRNASGTKLQMNGAAFGKGIYLSPYSATSAGYSRMYNQAPYNPVKQKDQVNFEVTKSSEC